MDKYYEGVLMAISVGAISALLLYVPLAVKHRILNGSPTARKKQQEIVKKSINSLEGRMSIGHMQRVWYNERDNVYKDAVGNKVHAISLKQEVRSDDNLPQHLGTLITEIENTGNTTGANAFSFTELRNIHGSYVFGVLYHKI